MSKKLLRLLALLFAFSLVAAACGDDDGGGSTASSTPDDSVVPDPDTPVVDDSERTPGGSVIVGIEAEATGLRPWDDSLSSPALNLVSSIYDRILDQDENGEYKGYLAESFEANDDLSVWTVTLRSGIEFSDGTPLTAQTIVDMFELQKVGTAGSSAIASSGLESVAATGDLVVEYTLKTGNVGFPSFLQGNGLGYVFEPAAAAADPEGFNTNPIGTGPFVLDKRDIDNETVLVRNPTYWFVDENGTQLPYLDSITFRPIPDETTRLQSLQSGTITVMQTLRQATIRDARAAAESGDLTLYEHQGNESGGGHYNTSVAPFDDKRVRNGLTLLNNQEAVVKSLGGEGISDPATQFFSPDSPWYSDNVAAAWPQFDVAAGTAKIQEYVDDPARSDGKAVGDSIDVELSCPPDPTLLAAMGVLEQVWSSTGLINVTLTNFDQATHINKALGLDNGLVGDHGAHCWRWGSEADPSSVLNPAFGEVATTAGNVSDFNDPELTRLLDEAAATDDVEVRKGLYEEAGLIIADNTPIWFSGYTATALATEADVKGVNSWVFPDGTLGTGHPNAIARWGSVWIDQNA